MPLKMLKSQMKLKLKMKNKEIILKYWRLIALYQFHFPTNSMFLCCSWLEQSYYLKKLRRNYFLRLKIVSFELCWKQFFLCLLDLKDVKYSKIVMLHRKEVYWSTAVGLKNIDLWGKTVNCENFTNLSVICASFSL